MAPKPVDLLRRLLVQYMHVDDSKLATEDDVIKEAQAALSKPTGRLLMVVEGGVLNQVADGNLIDDVWDVDVDNGEAGDIYVLPSYMRDLCEKYWGKDSIPRYVQFDGEEVGRPEAPRG